MLGKIASTKLALGRFLSLDPEHRLAVFEVKRDLRGTCAAHVDRKVQTSRTLVKGGKHIGKVSTQFLRRGVYGIGRDACSLHGRLL